MILPAFKNHNQNCRGLTLVEMLLALAGTAFVGAAMSAMLFSVTRGTQDRTDVRKFVVKQKMISHRVTAAVREAAMILECEDDLLVLWINDDDGNGQPSLGEVRRITRNSISGDLSSYTAPDSLAEVDNVVFDLATTDFKATTLAYEGDANFPQTVWATNLSTWQASANDPDPQVANLASFRMTLEVSPGGLQNTAISAVSIRNY